MMSRCLTRLTPVLLSMVITACGGPAPSTPPAEEAATRGAAWLQGLHASDLTEALRERGLACGEPRQERETRHWTCEVATPLTGYRVDFYGKVPGRLEYLKATITQANRPDAARAIGLLDYVAGLPYETADPTAARAWVEQHLESGGQTAFGQAKYKVSGNLSRLVLEIKAPGSEW